MPRGLTDFQKRYRGQTFENDFDETPRCDYCGRKMKIQARSKPHHVAGMEENYNIIKVYRRCGNKDCPGSHLPPVSPPDKYAFTGYDVDFEVMAEICELRNKHRRIISTERKSRGSLSIIMHVPEKWKGKMAALREKLSNLKRAISETS